MISKIVLTGGPCSGKTTALSFIVNQFTKKNYNVLVVPETATELIPNGISSATCGAVEFQRVQIALQLKKEQLYENIAQLMEGNTLIVCDRGILDAKAYIDQNSFTDILDYLNMDETEIRDSYDGVFHLVTAAKGTNAYTLENNIARTETPEEAIKEDEKTMNAWIGHPHLRVIDNSTGFEEKIDRLIAEICALLGEPAPFEIERKFLINYPDIKYLNTLENCKKVQIVQTYLKSNDPNVEIRVRQRGSNGSYVYYETIKRKVSGIKRIEHEKRLTEREYIEKLTQADTKLHPIIKDRYCLMYKNQYFEIDIYPFWTSKAIMEIELKSEDQEIIVPDMIKIIKEVTDDPIYKNHSLARIQ